MKVLKKNKKNSALRACSFSLFLQFKCFILKETQNTLILILFVGIKIKRIVRQNFYFQKKSDTTNLNYKIIGRPLTFHFLQNIIMIFRKI